MATRRKTDHADPVAPESERPVDRFHLLTQQAAPKRRGAYHLTDDLVIPPLTLGRKQAVLAADSEQERLEILLGDKHAEILALFRDREIEDWDEFIEDVYAHYFGEGARQLPGGSQGS